MNEMLDQDVTYLNLYLTLVHVLQQKIEVSLVDVFEKYDRPLLAQVLEQVVEVRGADAQDEFVCRKKFVACSKCHIREIFTFTKLLCANKKLTVMIIPLQQKLFRHFQRFIQSGNERFCRHWQVNV